MANGMMPGTPVNTMPDEAGQAQDQIEGLLGAVQVLGDTITQAPGIPDEIKQNVASATEGYINAITQAVTGGGGAEPMAPMEGGQPVEPQGMMY